MKPQDRTGRVGYDRLIDSTGRIEFVSRIFVELDDSKTMYSYPKLRKMFAAASVTFNVEAPFHDACAVKMLSLIAVAEQCHLQSEIYAMLFRYHQHHASEDDLNVKRRKYDWWEFTLMMLVKDNNLAESRKSVYEHLMRKASDWQTTKSHAAMLKSLSQEMQMETEHVQRMIDAAKDIDGTDAQQVTDMVRRYVAALPPV